MFITNTTAPANPTPASTPSIGPVHAGSTVKIEIRAASPTVAAARARRRGANMRSELRTGSCAATASATATRASSGVGGRVLTSGPSREPDGSDQERDDGDRHADPEVIGGLSQRPEAREDARRHHG